jgi:hypothetical protein
MNIKLNSKERVYGPGFTFTAARKTSLNSWHAGRQSIDFLLYEYTHIILIS